MRQLHILSIVLFVGLSNALAGEFYSTELLPTVEECLTVVAKSFGDELYQDIGKYREDFEERSDHNEGNKLPELILRISKNQKALPEDASDLVTLAERLFELDKRLARVVSVQKVLLANLEEFDMYLARIDDDFLLVGRSHLESSINRTAAFRAIVASISEGVNKRLKDKT